MNFFINLLSVSLVFLVSVMSIAMLLSAFYFMPFDLGYADNTSSPLPTAPNLNW